MTPSLLGRLHAATIRVQVPVVLGAIPLIAGTYALMVARLAPSIGAAVWSIVGVVALATVAAGLLLRGSLRSTVERIEAATLAIADGTFAHRIQSGRGDELGRLAAAIDTMAERLERLEQSRRRLLACVSHELRTPLTIIRGTAFTLGRNEPDPDRRQRLELVQDEAARLATLIEDLVDASSLHAGSVRLDVETCDLGTLVRATCARFDCLVRARGVAIDLRSPQRRMPVDVDPVRFDQALGNLLANAIRHAEVGSSVRVDVDAADVVVSNRGAAIPQLVRDRIFEPFVQGDGGGRLGLGLAIAHGLVASHGGELTLDADGSRGTDITFRIHLPAARPRVTALASARPRRRARHARAVVVES